MTQKTSAFRNAIRLLLILGFISSFTGCKKNEDPAPDPRKEKFKLLSGTWRLSSVVNDEVDVTAEYAGFTLIINSNQSFTTTNGHNPWPAAGTLEFTDNTLTTWQRNDDVQIKLLEATATSLQISFTQNELANGRKKGVTGEFVFSLIK